MTLNLEWKIRLKMLDGTVRVGGYVGSHDSKVYVADEFTGEVVEYDHKDVDDIDARKY